MTGVTEDKFLNRMRETFYDLIALYPPLARGALHERQLRELGRRIARRAGFRIEYVVCAHPWPATITRIAHTLVIIVDNRRNVPQRVGSLAHEIGHLAFGHYALEGFWTDADGPASREEDDEADLFSLLVLNKNMSPLDFLGREQIEMPMNQ